MRVLVTGSAEGLGNAAADALLTAGHEVVLHLRSRSRLGAVRELMDRGAEVVVGDLADRDEVRDMAVQVAQLEPIAAVIHNAGVGQGSASVVAVNVVAPYLLTALLPRPDRLVYLSSGMHRGGRPDVSRLEGGSYSDSKLFVSTLAAAVARRWPDVASSSVDPGWVPTRMGGPSAPDDLRLGHVTQVWLATSDDPAALSGGYWRHQAREAPHRSVDDVQFQDQLLDALAEMTGVELAGPGLA